MINCRWENILGFQRLRGAVDWPFSGKRDVELSSSNHIDSLINKGNEDILRLQVFMGIQRLT